MRVIAIVIALGGTLVFCVACGKDDASVQSAQARPVTPSGNGGAQPDTAGLTQTLTTRVPDASGIRQGPSVTLSASDIATVRRNTIEEGIAITGDLHPIETVNIRARIEGDVVSVAVREGERVRAGQILAHLEASEQESNVKSAEADRVSAQSELSTAQWNLEQTNELYRAGAVSELDLKTSQQGVTSARARLAAAEARVRATTSLLRDTRVTAPTSGVISRRVVENGEHVARGAELFTVVRSDVLELAAAVPARFANAVRAGQTVHFAADGRSFDGKVARVSPTVDPTTRSVSVYVQVPNASGGLKGGTFASGRVISRVVPSTLVVPSAAIRQSPDDGRPFVYRLAGRSIDVARIEVGVVDERAALAEVVSGLSDGDRVIVGNVGTLGRGMQVIIAGEERPAGQRPNAP